jgi:hypothetical protein
MSYQFNLNITMTIRFFFQHNLIGFLNSIFYSLPIPNPSIDATHEQIQRLILLDSKMPIGLNI